MILFSVSLQLTSFHGDLPPEVPHYARNRKHQINRHVTQLTAEDFSRFNKSSNDKVIYAAFHFH